MNQSLSIGIISILMCFLIAEFFGRSKHIGRWWTFFLLLSGLIPGIIAVIASPSAKKKPTQGGKNYNIWGWICLVFGLGNTIALIGSEGKTGQLFFAFFILSHYLFELAKGKIINKEPKYYFDNLEFNSGFFANQHGVKTESNSANIAKSTDEIKFILGELRGNGTFNESEYLNFLGKIKEEETQTDILNSNEYLKLKQLYDAGVLEKFEFDCKIKVLKNNFNKEGSQIENNIKAEPIIAKEKRNAHSVLYYSITGVILLILCLINWDEALYELKDFNDSYNRNAQENEAPSIDTNFETVKNMEAINPTKFVYVLIKIKEPKFSHLDGYRQMNDNLVYEQVIEERNEVFWEEVIYTTDINEIKDFNEDAKYRFLDEVEPIIRMKLAYADSNFSNNVYGKCTDASKKSSLVENHSKLIDKNIFVFDSYKEASIHREKSSNLSEKPSESIVNYSVNQTRAYFYNKPNYEDVTNAFLVYRDSFQSSKVENNFVYVIYTSISGKETKGWINASNLSRE